MSGGLHLVLYALPRLIGEYGFQRHCSSLTGSQVEGTAYITGQHTFLIDPDDPFKNGFFLR